MTCGLALSQATERAEIGEKSAEVANEYAKHLGWWAQHGPEASGIIAGVVAVVAAALGVFTGFEIGRGVSHGR